MIEDYEKLGAFYLGRLVEPRETAPRDQLLLYDSKDLTTHGLCVGMTGSGKTGLCLSLIEEAAIDGIPVLAVDPKGDLGNLRLTFPELRPADFLPWLDPAAATREGLSLDAFAKETSQRWRNGLAEWGQPPSRIQRFQNAADVAIYTPGSSAGLPFNVLRSFAAPPSTVITDPDALRDRVEASVSGLLALLRLDADPVRSREHILLSSILLDAWQAGRDLDLPGLIREIQRPPFDKVGVFDLESFFPAADRLSLAMATNNLLASPRFAGWLEGEPLDAQRLLYTAHGTPRISIVSISHLSESERMFVVTLLLNELLTWTRSQPGTSSLRALFYMDEIFGYFPPTANPPAKRPLLTLLKQARAHGVGLLLATQNPVDLDYKGLSNIGTWFLGRLQTERDKQRVLDGLEGAAAGAAGASDRAWLDTVLSGLGSRRFLLHNVHEDEPVVFHTRWALSYLRGPMTRVEIERLMAPAKVPPAPAAAPSRAELPARPDSVVTERPAAPATISQFILGCSRSPGSDDRVRYRPRLLAEVRLHYVRASVQLDTWVDRAMLAPFPDAGSTIAWADARRVPHPIDRFEDEPEPDAEFTELPAAALHPPHYRAWQRSLASYLYQQAAATLFRCEALKAASRLGETEGDFRGRLRHQLHEQRDLEIEKLRRRYGSKLATVQDRIRRAEARLEREHAQLEQARLNTAISVGATVLGALFGRKLTSQRNISRASSAVRGLGRSSREELDIETAREELEAQQQKLQELEAEFRETVARLADRFDSETVQLTPLVVRPRKSDISLFRFGLAWVPWRTAPDGTLEPLSVFDPAGDPVAREPGTGAVTEHKAGR